MFESLTERLGATLANLTGKAKLTEENIQGTLREVRIALLEADVALSVVKEFIDRVRVRAVGLEIASSLSPGQVFVKIVNEEHNILLTGSPDGVFVRGDGSHIIVDYKTSRHTKNQDRLYPIYETQLNAYALIGEECGLDPVTGLALIYTEPLTDDQAAADDANHNGDGFALGFSVHIVDVPLDASILEPLMAKTRAIYDLTDSPPGRSNCKDCQHLTSLMELAAD